MASTTHTDQGGEEQLSTGSHRSDQLLVGPESDQTPVLSVVMPTLNEEEGIAECLERAKNAVAELEMPTEIILSDSSTDRTPEIGAAMGATVVEPDKPGYGYAYRYAFERVRGEYVVMGDADTTYDFESIPRLLRHLQETDADLVMGSRLDGEIQPGSMPPLHQHIGNPLLTKFLNLFYGASVSDAHSGFRVLRREALETMDLSTSGMEFASEMIMEAGALGLEIEELPIVYHEREGEETLDSFRDGWRHVRFMLVNAPGYLFSVPGLLFGLFGVSLMTLAYGNFSLGEASFGLHTMLFGSLLTIMGFQVASFGILATVASDPIRTPTDPVTTVITEHVSLERGATIGLVVFAGGTVYAGLLLTRWIANGLGSVSFTLASLLAFTAIILGGLIVFSSFFMSVLAETR